MPEFQINYLAVGVPALAQRVRQFPPPPCYPWGVGSGIA